MKMVAGVESFAELRGMLWVADCGIKIDDSIEGSARTYPLVHCLANRLSVGGKVACSVKWSQGRSKDPDSMLVRAVDDLPQAHDQIVGGHVLPPERAFLRRRCIFWLRKLQVWPTDIVDSFQHDQRRDAGLGQHIAVEAGQCAYSGPIMQDTVASDSLVCHRDRCSVIVGKTFREQVGPVTIFALLCPDSVGDGI